MTLKLKNSLKRAQEYKAGKAAERWFRDGFGMVSGYEF
jgi:hypothetical protein